MAKLKLPKPSEVKTWQDFVKEVLGIANGNLPNQISAQTARSASKNSFIAVFCEKGIVVNCSSEPRIADYERGDDYFAVAVIYHARKTLSVPDMKSEDLLDPARIGAFAVEIQAAATEAVKKIDQEPWYKKKAGRKENINNFSKWVSDWKDANPISVDSPKNDDDDGGSDKKPENSKRSKPTKKKTISVKKFKPKTSPVQESTANDDDDEESGKKSGNSKEGPSASDNESKLTKKKPTNVRKIKPKITYLSQSSDDDDDDDSGPESLKDQPGRKSSEDNTPPPKRKPLSAKERAKLRKEFTPKTTPVNPSTADDDKNEDKDELKEEKSRKEDEESSNSEKIEKEKPKTTTNSTGEDDATTSGSQAQSQSEEESSEEEKVTYNIQIGREAVRQIELKKSATINDAKIKIAKENGDVDPRLVSIIFAGKVLKDSLLIENLRLIDTDILQVLIANTSDIFLRTAKALRVDRQQDAEEYYSDYEEESDEEEGDGNE